jgi:polyisoprenoid-binding protein YceI
MKNLKTIAIALFLAAGTLTVSAQSKNIDVKKSAIKWHAEKVTGQHEGNISFKDGSVIFKAGKVTGGSFTVDMTSITVTDIKADQGADKLTGHLKADDFFGVEKFPTSKLVFKTIAAKANGVYTVTADLTIKGITKPVTFDLATTATTATTKFKIDRTKYGIEYNSKSIFSSIGDKAIYDEFEVTVNLAF